MGTSGSVGIKKASILKRSTIAILSVFFVEACLGLIVESLAILSDSLHALFDVVSSLLLFISVRVSLKPPDENHMYGHEKFEPVGGLIGGFTLLVLAVFIAVESILKLLGGQTYINLDYSFAGFVALGYTFSIDLVRMFIFRSALKDESPTVKVGFYHALSDLSSTLIALLGFWLATYGISYGDSVASLLLSSLLIFLSVRFVWSNIMELSDMAPKETVRKVEKEILKVGEGALNYENLKVRRAGEKFYIRATLRVPDYMSLEEAHDLSARIEANILKSLGNADISFHIEPAKVTGVRTREFIERLASGVEGVKGVHNVEAVYYGGKIYVTLHVQVDPSASLSEAHKAAERIERIIAKNVDNVGNVLVHIEPSNIESKRGHVSDEEINNIVRLAAEKHGDELKVKRVTTYTSNGKRYVGIECVFEKDMPVVKAHKVASEIEAFIKEKISETVVTVHMETENSVALN